MKFIKAVDHGKKLMIQAGSLEAKLINIKYQPQLHHGIASNKIKVVGSFYTFKFISFVIIQYHQFAAQ